MRGTFGDITNRDRELYSAGVGVKQSRNATDRGSRQPAGKARQKRGNGPL